MHYVHVGTGFRLTIVPPQKKRDFISKTQKKMIKILFLNVEKIKRLTWCQNLKTVTKTKGKKEKKLRKKTSFNGWNNWNFSR